MFDKKRKGTGTNEWADWTENICIGCPNNCRYCYAAHRADRLKYQPRENWTEEKFSKRVNLKKYPKGRGVVMFPSTHDITAFNVKEYIRVARLILQSGNFLLIVSKPRVDIIEQVCAGLADYKDQVLFRFTIGTLSEPVSLLWEPGAPCPDERVDALILAWHQGYRTSVSIEPMLEGVEQTIELVGRVEACVTDSIWIGKMNKVEQRVQVCPEILPAVESIKRFQSDENIVRLYNRLNRHRFVMWKDSISEVVVR